MPRVSKDPAIILIRNAAIDTGRLFIGRGQILVREGRIEEVTAQTAPLVRAAGRVLDARGFLVAPGFIDIHVHGGGGYDTTDGTSMAIIKMAETFLKYGVTGLLPTIYPGPWRHMLTRIRAVADAMGLPGGQSVLGVNLEGPFLSAKQHGALDPKFFRAPSVVDLEAMQEAAKGNLRLMTIAPELDGAMEVIKAARRYNIRMAVGHSDATYEETLNGINAGITHVTHTFNAMRRMHHRDPGVVGAALGTEELYCEVVADGAHLHPQTLAVLLLAKPLSRVVLITDAVRQSGTQVSRFYADGRKAHKVGQTAYLEDGTIAGSLLTLNQAVAKMVGLHRLTEADALRMASLHPARAIHVDDRKGSLVAGKDADLVILDEKFNVHLTMQGGKVVYRTKPF